MDDWCHLGVIGRARCCTVEDWCQVKVCVYHRGLVSGQGVRAP